MPVFGAGTFETHNIKERGLVTLPKSVLTTSREAYSPTATADFPACHSIIKHISTNAKVRNTVPSFLHPSELYPEPQKITALLPIMRK